MKLVLLDAKTLGDDLDLTPLKRFGELVIYPTTSKDEILERIRDADIVITNKVILNRETLMMAPKLKLICITATGMNNIDLKASKGMGIEVKNVANYSTSSVAQHTFAILFYLLEQLNYYDEFVKSGKWAKSKLFTNLDRPFSEIENKKWGIIGLGAIGQKVASLATSFGANVSYYSTSKNPHSDTYPHKDLKELLSSSDIISIHAPLNENTKDLISKEELSLLKERAILINVGRGGIVDEEALAKALDEREFYAGLDVTSIEPLPADSPLLNIKYKDRLLITPHIAWTSIEARRRLLDGVVRNIKEFLERGK